MEVGVLAITVYLWGLLAAVWSVVFSIWGVLSTMAHFSSSSLVVSVLSLRFPVFCILHFSWAHLWFRWALSFTGLFRRNNQQIHVQKLACLEISLFQWEFGHETAVRLIFHQDSKCFLFSIVCLLLTLLWHLSHSEPIPLSILPPPAYYCLPSMEFAGCPVCWSVAIIWCVSFSSVGH